MLLNQIYKIFITNIYHLFMNNNFWNFQIQSLNTTINRVNYFYSFYYMSSYFALKTFIIIITFCLIPPTSSLYSKNCHYTCTYCLGPEYDRCIICQEGLQLTAVKNKDKIGQLYYNWLEDHPSGSCLGQIKGFNVFGITLFTITLVIFGWFRNRTIFYFLNTLQTFALFSLVQVGYNKLVSYVIRGFEYFMLMSAVMKDNKKDNLEIFEDGRYRLYEFMREYNFQKSFLPVFICSSCTFLLAFLITICKHFAKEQKSIWAICSCVNISKILNFVEISSIAVFFFLIQETVLIIVVGVFLNSKFSENPLNIGLVVVYALLFALMMINLCSKNMDLFANKALEQIEILKKCLTPIFVVMPVKLGVILPGFIFFVAFLGLLFTRIKPSDKTPTEFHEKLIKRQFGYRIVQLFAIGVIVTFWVIQNQVRTLNANTYAGIAAAAIIGVYLLCFLIETGILLYGKYWKKQDQKLYEVPVNSMSSMRQTNWEETLENFETTEEGIMDMIFFGRNLQQKESPKKNNNIQLNLDHLNEQFEQRPEETVSKSPKTSPKNRKFQNRTSRTPKNDRSSRFKLTKVAEPENKQLEIDQVDINEETAQKSHQMSAYKSQRDDNYPQVKTGRKYESFRTVREMKAELGEDQKSPRFGVEGDMQVGFYKQDQRDNKRQGRLNARQGGKSSMN